MTYSTSNSGKYRLPPLAFGPVMLAAALVLGGCPEQKQQPGETPDVTADNGARLARQALCEWMARCGQPSGACEEAAGGSTFGTTEALFASVQAGRAAMDPQAASACLQAIRSQSCAERPPQLDSLQACQAAFAGRVEPGAGCIASLACRAGHTCVQAEDEGGEACTGVCRALAEGACVRGADCGTGEVCDRGVCSAERAPGGAGEPCGSFDACLPGLACREQVTGAGVAFRCHKPPAQGEACSVGQACADASLVCVPNEAGSAATCRTSRGEGEACELPFECGGVASALVCVSGSCVRRPSSGDCVKAGGLGLCDPASAYCDESASSSVCRPFRVAGEACTSARQCGPDSACVHGGDGVARCVELPEPERCSP